MSLASAPASSTRSTSHVILKSMHDSYSSKRDLKHSTLYSMHSTALHCCEPLLPVVGERASQSSFLDPRASDCCCKIYFIMVKNQILLKYELPNRYTISSCTASSSYWDNTTITKKQIAQYMKQNLEFA